MMYSLFSEDGRGDSGGMSMTFKYDDTGKMVDITQDGRPEIGKQIRVGSTFARSLRYQDWWQTSEITEILIDSPDYVKFKTLNSIYEWKSA